jgi:hypothetical protein
MTPTPAQQEDVIERADRLRDAAQPVVGSPLIRRLDDVVIRIRFVTIGIR